jgi:hypothetical protein
MRDATKRRIGFLAGFGLYFGALWFLWDSPVIYPLKIFVVFLHEISHGIMAIATGGSIERIVLNPMEGGACYCSGGIEFLTLSAGYLGSLAWGAAILTIGQEAPKLSRKVAGLIGIMALVLTALYVRSWFGVAFGVGFGLLMLLSARKLSVGVNRTLLTVLGFTSCLYAILDIKSDILDRPGLESDAHMLAEMTGIPTVIWGVLWIGIALWVSAMLFRRAYRRAGRPRASPDFPDFPDF